MASFSKSILPLHPHPAPKLRHSFGWGFVCSRAQAVLATWLLQVGWSVHLCHQLGLSAFFIMIKEGKGGRKRAKEIIFVHFNLSWF